MKILVAYYSRTGHTEQLAKAIAAACHGELERILDARGDRGGVLGYLRSGWQAALGRAPAIRIASLDPADYDLVVLGSPVWNWSLSAPVRSYARLHADQFKRVAFFCTEGGSGERRLFAQLRRLCGQPPCAAMVVKEHEIGSRAYAHRLDRFIAKLTGPGSKRPPQQGRPIAPR